MFAVTLGRELATRSSVHEHVTTLRSRRFRRGRRVARPFNLLGSHDESVLAHHFVSEGWRNRSGAEGGTDRALPFPARSSAALPYPSRTCPHSTVRSGSHREESGQLSPDQ